MFLAPNSRVLVRFIKFAPKNLTLQFLWGKIQNPKEKISSQTTPPRCLLYVETVPSQIKFNAKQISLKFIHIGII